MIMDKIPRKAVRHENQKTDPDGAADGHYGNQTLLAVKALLRSDVLLPRLDWDEIPLV